MKKLTLYIIDDEAEVVQALITALKPNKRFTVRGFTTAGEVRAAMDALPPQLAICDYNMPECDGLELLRELKERFPRLRSVLLTGEGFSPQVIEGLEQGLFEQYVSKPYKAAELEETMLKLARQVAKEL
jgi:DNA-binding NtrC family response regulator